jgi:hypothetical protein
MTQDPPHFAQLKFDKNKYRSCNKYPNVPKVNLTMNSQKENLERMTLHSLFDNILN